MVIAEKAEVAETSRADTLAMGRQIVTYFTNITDE